MACAGGLKAVRCRCSADCPSSGSDPANRSCARMYGSLRLRGFADVTVTLDSLRAAGMIAKNVKYVKLFGEGRLSRAYTVCGIPVTKGARAAIEAGGGRIEG